MNRADLQLISAREYLVHIVLMHSGHSQVCVLSGEGSQPRSVLYRTEVPDMQCLKEGGSTKVAGAKYYGALLRLAGPMTDQD